MIELEPDNFDGLCDVGYLSFTLGLKGGLRRWGAERQFFRRTLLILDSGFNHRYLINPLYKARRKEKRTDDPEWQLKYEEANRFRHLLRQDPTVASVELHGFEADDVLAYLYLLGWGSNSAIAQDKDLYQVPGLRDIMCGRDGEQTERKLKLPKYHIPPITPQDYLLAQVLRGDKSDSIERLLPSSGPQAKNLYEKLVRWYEGDYERIWWNICYWFGHDKVFENIFLTLMPSPFLSRIYTGPVNFNYEEPFFSRLELHIDRMKLLEMIIDGTYWDPSNFDDRYIEVMRANRDKHLEALWQEETDAFDIYFQKYTGDIIAGQSSQVLQVGETMTPEQVEDWEELEGLFWEEGKPPTARRPRSPLYPPPIEESYID